MSFENLSFLASKIIFLVSHFLLILQYDKDYLY
nr:MAG TPA: hypothetical protein [Caudoviricetes sp.]